MGEVLVLVDFAGQRDDELQLKAGDIVQKVESGPEEGWLQGELAGKTGLFPRQFVQEIPASLMADGGRRCPRSTRFAKKPPVQGQRWCKVNFSYTPEKADELQLKAGELVQILQEIEDGWWLGRKNGQVGAFPSNFVQELDRLPPGLVAPEPLLKNGAGKQRPKLTDETFIIKEAEKPEPPKKLEKPIPAAQSPLPSQPLQPYCEAEYCKAMFDYEPELQDELQLKRGDVVLVLCKETEDEGWWEGECGGKRGLFPDNFVILLQPLVPKIKAVVPSRSQESIFRPEKKVSSAIKAELRPTHEPKEPKVQKKMDLPKMNLPASKKAAPAPPVPAKTKLASSLAGRSPCTPTNCVPASAEKSKPKDPDANCFDAVLISNAKLSHPTTTRPKMPGRKPPSQPPASSPHVKAPLLPAKSSVQASEPQPPESLGDPPKAQEKLSLEELLAELRSLRILMDLMRVQHQKDMEELKMEIKEEQAKRMVLQVEIESMKQMPALEGAGAAGPGSELEELPATL
ncbi:SH3 domain-containing protein 21 [Terrapene carolina triunguis]|uniref:SH3 domain-containing protein 21 n=1 Tax=Terrapene triunguis TaxID=2587831 RepID=UPI000E77521F|nr:SH3 domain-containing protein 21 [Terrapene carolina triunguis]